MNEAIDTFCDDQDTQQVDDLNFRQIVKQTISDKAVKKIIKRLKETTIQPECDECGSTIELDFAAKTGCWNRVVGTEDNPRGEGIILCINCFAKKAAKKGIALSFVYLFSRNGSFLWSKKDHSRNIIELEHKVIQQKKHLNRLQQRCNALKILVQEFLGIKLKEQ